MTFTRRSLFRTMLFAACLVGAQISTAPRAGADPPECAASYVECQDRAYRVNEACRERAQNEDEKTQCAQNYRIDLNNCQNAHDACIVGTIPPIPPVIVDPPLVAVQ